jgi:hypothetical protein
MSSSKRRALKPPQSDSCPRGNVAEQSPYVPTDAERDAAIAVLARRAKHPPLPLLTSSKNGDRANLSYEHPDHVVAECVLATQIAAGDDRLAQLIVSQLVNTTARGNEVHTRDLNLALTVVQGIEPKDTVETLLATQMAAVYIETMKAARRLANAEMIPQHDSALMAVNKLARTFAAQVEALKKHRSAGEQSIRVEHVTVNEGGQAIVGVVHPQEGRGDAKIESQSHEPCASVSESPPLLGQVEANGKALPSPISTRAEGLPVSRGRGRRANGTN